MTLDALRDSLERHQVQLYFASVALGAVVASLWTKSGSLEPLLNPALAFMLFVTFLQVPLARLGKAFTDARFLGALAVANFVVVPVLAFGMIQLLPHEPLVILGVLFVLLTPCIDYVVTFTHLGKGDAQSLLASTPLLLLAQMALLPVYLNFMVGEDAAALITPGPFVHAFVYLIAFPLAAAAAFQLLAKRSEAVAAASRALGLLPVPATALVLFVVVCSVVPQLALASGSVLTVLPVYIGYAVVAPILGLLVASGFALPPGQRRAVAFSAATRNSLVILPLALAVPGAIPVVPAVIVTQTLVELIAELLYVRLSTRWLSLSGRR